MDQGEQCDECVGAPPSRPQLGRDRVARVCLVRTFSTHSSLSAGAKPRASRFDGDWPAKSPSL